MPLYTLVEWLRNYSDSYVPASYNETLAEIREPITAMHLNDALKSEYKIFEELCTIAAHKGKRACTMEFKRTRDSLRMLIKSCYSDPDISPEEAAQTVLLLEAQDSHFSDEEVPLIEKVLKEKFAQSGFENGKVIVNRVDGLECPKWCNTISISAVW